MSEAEPTTNLGILGWDAYEYVVSDMDRARQFYTGAMKLPEVARLDATASAERGEEAFLFAAGKARVVCVTPRGKGSRADRWLKRHPEGVAVIALRVRSVDATRRLLEERGAPGSAPG